MDFANDSFCEYEGGFGLAAGVYGDSRIFNDAVPVICKDLLHNVDAEVGRSTAISLNRLTLHVLCDRITGVLKALHKGMRDFAEDLNSTSTTSRTALKTEAIKFREGSDLTTTSPETGYRPLAYLLLRLRRARRRMNRRS